MSLVFHFIRNSTHLIKPIGKVHLNQLNLENDVNSHFICNMWYAHKRFWFVVLFIFFASFWYSLNLIRQNYGASIKFKYERKSKIQIYLLWILIYCTMYVSIDDKIYCCTATYIYINGGEMTPVLMKYTFLSFFL